MNTSLGSVPCMFQCTFAGCLEESDVALQQKGEWQDRLEGNAQSVVVQDDPCPAFPGRQLDALAQTSRDVVHQRKHEFHVPISPQTKKSLHVYVTQCSTR